MSSSGTCISTSGTLRFFFGLSFLPQPSILSSPVVLLLLGDLWPFLCDDAHRKSVNPVNTIVVMPMALVPSRYKCSFRVASDSGFVSLGRIADSAALDSSDTCPAWSLSIQRLVCCHLGCHFASRALHNTAPNGPGPIFAVRLACTSSISTMSTTRLLLALG